MEGKIAAIKRWLKTKHRHFNWHIAHEMRKGFSLTIYIAIPVFVSLIMAFLVLAAKVLFQL